MTFDEDVAVQACQCRVCQSGTATQIIQYHQQIKRLLTRLSEPQRRWYVGTLSQAPDTPGDRQLAIITGLDAKTIRRGRREVAAGFATLPSGRQRQPGAGQPRAEKKTPPSKR